MPICQSCGEPLPPPARTGRPRQFCSSRCRVEAHRDRQAVDWTTPAAPATTRRDDLVAAAEAILDDAPTRQPEERLALALIEARLLEGEFKEVSHRVPPPLAWRAETMSETIRGGLDRLFPTSQGEA